MRTPVGSCLRFVRKAIQQQTDNCIDWPFWRYPNGYGGIVIKQKKLIVSRVVCEMAHGAPEDEKLQAAHSCNNRGCINPRHIRWATVAENHADKIKHGTTNRGERQGLSVLTEDQVIWARAEYAKGDKTYKQLAAQIGVKWGTLAAAIKGTNWKFIEPPKKAEQATLALEDS